MAEAVSKFCGLDRFGDDRPWNVGGHDLTVRFERDPDSGEWRMRVLAGWPGGGRDARRTLALLEVFAMATTGQPRDRLGGPESFVWKVRALVEMGFVQLPRVRFPALPDNAPETACLVFNLIGYLISIRNLRDPVGTPFPCSVAWLVGWSGGKLSERQAEAGRTWLDRHQFLIRTGETAPSKRGAPMNLWLLVDPETGEVAGGRPVES